MVCRATLCDVFQTGTSPIGTPVNIVDGAVTLDGRADVRGTIDITVNENWPIRQNDPLAPYGQELYVERGIRYSDALVEYVGLGYFRIDTLSQEDVTAPVISIKGQDRMAGIVEGRLLEPRQFLNGTTFGVVVENLVTDIYPNATIEWDDSTDLATLTRSIIVEEDRFGFLNDAITSRGKIWYWDHRGVLVIKDIPAQDEPVYEIRNGTLGVLVSLPRTLTREGATNAIVATGEGADTLTPVRGVAIDDDPDSPTYFFGSFGQVPEFYSSSFLETEAQCEAAAQSILERRLGIFYDVSFGTIVNPALEPYDPVLIKAQYNEAQQNFTLDVVEIPLYVDGVMTSQTRTKQVVLAP